MGIGLVVCVCVRMFMYVYWRVCIYEYAVVGGGVG